MRETGCTDGDLPAGADFRRRFRFGRLELELWIARGRVVVRAAGELDLQSAPGLAAALAEARGHARDPGVLFLVEGLGFADSSGLGVLVAAFKRADSAGGAVALSGAGRFLDQTLRITGLTPLLPSFPNEGEASAWLDRKNLARDGNRPGGYPRTGVNPA
jgi:anti-anti-sigma factor